MKKRASGAGKAAKGVAGGVNRNLLNAAGHPLGGFASAAPQRNEKTPANPQVRNGPDRDRDALHARRGLGAARQEDEASRLRTRCVDHATP